jgi:hypothetical protein
MKYPRVDSPFHSGATVNAIAGPALCSAVGDVGIRRRRLIARRWPAWFDFREQGARF